MSTTNRDICIESALPVVSSNGLNTNMAIDFSNAPSAALPAATTIGGSAVVALASITTNATTGVGFGVTGTGIYTGTGLVNYTNNALTTGVLQLISGNGLTTGTLLSVAHTTSVIADGGSLVRLSSTSIDTGGATNGTILDISSTAQLAGTIVKMVNILTTGTAMSITGTGILATTGNLLTLTGNSATTTTGLLQVSGTGLTSGSIALLTGGGANMTSGGKVLEIAMGAATVGQGLTITSTGVYTGTNGLLSVTGNSATTTTGLFKVNGLGVTSGIIEQVNATAATLTTGRYVSYNDAATEVFGIGANGHIHSTVSAAPPTIAVTTQNGITAAAITAGGSDTCGIITTTGTSTDSTLLTITFGKTYTTAPKAVILVPANAAAAMPNSGYYVSAVTATTFQITVVTGGTYAATPSWRYVVIA